MNSGYFPLVFILCNPSDLMNTRVAVLRRGAFALLLLCCLIKHGVSFSSTLLLHSHDSSNMALLVTVNSCSAVPDGTSNLLKIRKPICCTPTDLCCCPVWIYSKSNFPPIGKLAAGMNDRLGGKSSGLNSLCVWACLCLCFRSLPEALISPNISTLTSEGTHTFSLGYS